MNWWMSVIVPLAVVAGVRPGFSSARPTPPKRDIGGEVRNVFATKCAGCHGPDLVKPKGRFGYVLDLRRLAGDPEKVIPFRPMESELWALVEHDEMPPPDSPHGALTPSQKEIIRSWLAEGAPDASAVDLESTFSVRSEPTTAALTEMAPGDRMLRWLGRFHLLLLHFPIALVLAAGVAEAWSVWRRNPIPSESVRFCLCLGALDAVFTAGLGWLHAAAGNGLDSPQLLAAHRLLGTTAAVWLVITAVFAERDARRGVRSAFVLLLLVFGVVITAITAHLGGLLAHGKDFFTY
jgi:uncharacterized membrane protein/mono/diheme cytochrome c family protein